MDRSSSACDCPTCTEAAARLGMAQVTHVESAARSDLLIAVAIAQAQSGTFEQAANEEIPQPIFERLYAKKCLVSAADHTGESYVYPTERGERLLAWILRRAAS